MEADAVCHKSNMKQLYFSHALFRKCLLRYVLIYNLEVSFNCHLTFLLLNAIEIFTVQKKGVISPVKTVFSLLPAIFFELLITQTPTVVTSISVLAFSSDITILATKLATKKFKLATILL